jgi:hypothetical protein
VGLTIVLVAPDDLSVAERSLWEAFPRGEWLDLRPDSPNGQMGGGPGIYSDAERVIRAEIIAALLLGALEPVAGCHPAIRLRGVQVTGRLDLMGATVTYALVCEHSASMSQSGWWRQPPKRCGSWTVGCLDSMGRGCAPMAFSTFTAAKWQRSCDLRVPGFPVNSASTTPPSAPAPATSRATFAR